MTQHNHEKLYDKEISPLLLKAAKKCNDHGLPFFAVVEYNPGEREVTTSKHGNDNLSFTMMRHAFYAKNDFDALVFGLIKYFKKENIDTSASLVVKMLTEPIK